MSDYNLFHIDAIANSGHKRLNINAFRKIKYKCHRVREEKDAPSKYKCKTSIGINMNLWFSTGQMWWKLTVDISYLILSFKLAYSNIQHKNHHFAINYRTYVSYIFYFYSFCITKLHFAVKYHRLAAILRYISVLFMQIYGKITILLPLSTRREFNYIIYNTKFLMSTI